MAVTTADIAQALRDALAPETLDVRDDSAAHVGHAGAAAGAHFSITVTSARFAGLAPIARHRLVYHALRLLIPQGVHALAIEARSPDERQDASHDAQNLP
jgi:BolA protein